MEYEARPRKATGEKKRPRNESPAFSGPTHAVIPQKPRAIAPKSIPSMKPVLGTVPWVPTPAVQSTVKVAVGKNDRVPSEIAAKFETTVDGKLLWFQQPPLDVVPPANAVHSIKYLEWKMKQGMVGDGPGADGEVGEAEEVEPVPAAKRVKVSVQMLESVTQGELVVGRRRDALVRALIHLFSSLKRTRRGLQEASRRAAR
jgi:hypothetical protein